MVCAKSVSFQWFYRNRQYYNYRENICAQRMMVIVWDRKNKKSFRRQRKICILDLINLIGTTRLANILNRNTQFLYKKQFLSKLNKSCNIFSWHGGRDYCAVYRCSNDRRKPEEATVMNHVGKLRWYGPKDQKDILKWQKLLNRGSDFKVSMSTEVCSNHFAGGYRSD